MGQNQRGLLPKIPGSARASQSITPLASGDDRGSMLRDTICNEQEKWQKLLQHSKRLQKRLKPKDVVVLSKNPFCCERQRLDFQETTLLNSNPRLFSSIPRLKPVRLANSRIRSISPRTDFPSDSVENFADCLKQKERWENKKAKNDSQKKDIMKKKGKVYQRLPQTMHANFGHRPTSASRHTDPLTLSIGKAVGSSDPSLLMTGVDYKETSKSKCRVGLFTAHELKKLIFDAQVKEEDHPFLEDEDFIPSPTTSIMRTRSPNYIDSLGKAFGARRASTVNVPAQKKLENAVNVLELTMERVTGDSDVVPPTVYHRDQSLLNGPPKPRFQINAESLQPGGLLETRRPPTHVDLLSRTMLSSAPGMFGSCEELTFSEKQLREEKNMLELEDHWDNVPYRPPKFSRPLLHPPDASHLTTRELLAKYHKISAGMAATTGLCESRNSVENREELPGLAAAIRRYEIREKKKRMAAATKK